MPRVEPLRAAFQAIYDAADAVADWDDEHFGRYVSVLETCGQLLLDAILESVDDRRAAPRPGPVIPAVRSMGTGSEPDRDRTEAPGASDPPSLSFPAAASVQPAAEPAPVGTPGTVVSMPGVAPEALTCADCGKAFTNTSGLAGHRYHVHEQPDRYDREAMFAAIRSTDRLLDAAEVLGITQVALSQRLDRLRDKSALPEDIAAKRRQPSAGPKVVDLPGTGLAPPLERPANGSAALHQERARAAADRTWRELHPEAVG